MTRLLALVALVGLLAACSADDPESPSPAGERPSTEATLSFVSPAPNAVTGPDVTVEVQLEEGEVVDRTSGELTPDEGHIHLSLDGRLVTMAYGNTHEVSGLTAGSHTLEAEFVAIDHAPFRNRVKAVVLFDVDG